MGVITNASGGGGNIRYDKTTQYIQVKDDQGWFNWRKAVRAFWDCITNVYATTDFDTLASRLTYSTDENTATLTCTYGIYGYGFKIFDTAVPQNGTLHIKGHVSVTTSDTSFRIGKNAVKNMTGATNIFTTSTSQDIDIAVSIEAGQYIFFGIGSTTGYVGYTATITDFYVD